MGDDHQNVNRRDVFISYGHADADWVRTLAENLYQSGLELFFDEWDIVPGDVLVHKLDAGILASRSGILVVSPTALTRPYVQAEYAALMGRAIERGQRLIPVLLKDTEIPPFLASHVWVDFRNVDGPLYETRVKELVRALKGERPGPPLRTGDLKPPPGTGYRAEGVIRRRLTIAHGEAILTGGPKEVRGSVKGLDLSLEDLLWRFGRARHHLGSQRDTADGQPGFAVVETLLPEVGARLGQAFLSQDVANALDADLTDAERLGCPLELALQVSDDFADLPWETLRLPSGGPALALHPRVHLYRRIGFQGPAPAISVPGPLRILVGIGSPEAQNARGELLYMEAELERILNAVDTPRREGKAYVRILETGGVKAIREALDQRRYHVLYISCHAAPGELILEDADGREDRVTAERLWQEAIPAGRAVPLAVLAACSTAGDAPDDPSTEAEALPGVARRLVAHGVPSVIAMQGPVGDRYATELAGELVTALATWQTPLALSALSEARRTLERERLKDTSPRQPPPEWATPAFCAAADPLPLYDVSAGFETIQEAPEPRLDRGVVVRQVGEMVGRRRETRLILKALRDEDTGGVLVHGIGGVGKSTLAAQVMHRLGQDGWLVVSLAQNINCDRVLGEVGRRLVDRCIAQSLDERHPLLRLAQYVREPKEPWRDRLDRLSQHVFGELPLVFLFDNFEDNLNTDRHVTGDLGDLLALWLDDPGRSRLLFTSRHPFSLPHEAESVLEALHLGPLSWAETRKLIWRLPDLNALSLEDSRRAYEEVGGHPRALEYLDALLRGTKPLPKDVKKNRFKEVEKRLKGALKDRGITDPSRWCADTEGDLDKALAETATLAAADVLFNDLLARLEDEPLARKLLIGASVYRVPVDEVGLMWLVGKSVEHAPDPARTAPPQAAEKRLREAEAHKGNLAAGPVAGLCRSDMVKWLNHIVKDVNDRAEENKPPVTAPEGFAAAKRRLLDSSLLAPVRFADDEEERFLVHRWTASALARRANEEEQRAAHRAAAAYWRWRFENVAKSRTNGLQEFNEHVQHLYEQRFHHHAAGDTEQSAEVGGSLCDLLDRRGAYEEVNRICRETLGWLHHESPQYPSFWLQLGVTAQRQGLREDARSHLETALACFQRQEDFAGVARVLQEFGDLELSAGRPQEAERYMRQALDVWKSLPADVLRTDMALRKQRSGIATCNANLAVFALQKGDFDRGVESLEQARLAFADLGDVVNVGLCFKQTGQARLDQKRYADARSNFEQATKIYESLGARSYLASVYNDLGTVAHHLKDFKQATSWYRRALETFEILGEASNIPIVYYNLGTIAEDSGDIDLALVWYEKASEKFDQTGQDARQAQTLSSLSEAHLKQGDAEKALVYALKSFSLRFRLGLIPQRPGISKPGFIDLLLRLQQAKSLMGGERFNEILNADPDRMLPMLPARIRHAMEYGFTF